MAFKDWSTLRWGRGVHDVTCLFFFPLRVLENKLSIWNGCGNRLFLISAEQRVEWRRASVLGKGKVETRDNVEAGQGRPGLGGWDLCD